MKGLILKDLYVILNQKNILLTLIILFVIFSFVTGDPGLLLTFLTVLIILQINTTLFYDESSQWNKFANTMPFPKSVIVKSKYILCLLLTLLLMVIVFPVYGITNMLSKAISLNEFASILCIILSSILIMLSFVIPLTIKFGVQKGRIFILALVFIPVITMNVLSNISFVNHFLQILDVFRFGVLIIAMILFYLSYKVSVIIYEKKEF